MGKEHELAAYCYVYGLGEDFFSGKCKGKRVSVGEIGRKKGVSIGKMSRKKRISMGDLNRKYGHLSTGELNKRLEMIRGEKETDYHQVLAAGVEMEAVKNGVELLGLTFQDLGKLSDYNLVRMMDGIRSGAKSIILTGYEIRIKYRTA